MLEAIKTAESISAMFPTLLKSLDYTFQPEAPAIQTVKSMQMLLERLKDVLLDEKDKRRNYAYKVRDMRRAQNAYFASAKEKDFPTMGRTKKISKQHEADVDQKTIEIIQGVEQPKIFGE